jgi:hypothetical protein
MTPLKPRPTAGAAARRRLLRPTLSGIEPDVLLDQQRISIGHVDVLVEGADSECSEIRPQHLRRETVADASLAVPLGPFEGCLPPGSSGSRLMRSAISRWVAAAP